MVEFFEVSDLNRTFELQMPGRVIFGVGTVKEVGPEAKAMHAKNVLIVTDRGVAEMGLADRVREPLIEEGLKVDVWDQVEPEPSIVTVEKLLEHIKRGNFDLLIGVGGGSSMDVAKAVAVLLNNPGNPEDYFAGGKKEFENPGLSCITVPTTAGTGAEITWDSVIKDRTGMKAFYEHRYIRPNLAIVDPVMSSSMPPPLL